MSDTDPRPTPSPEERAEKAINAIVSVSRKDESLSGSREFIAQQIREAIEAALKSAGDCDGCGGEMVDAFCLGCKGRAESAGYVRGRANGDTMIREHKLNFDEAVKIGTDIGTHCSFRAAGWAVVTAVITSAIWSIAS